MKILTCTQFFSFELMKSIQQGNFWFKKILVIFLKLSWDFKFLTFEHLWIQITKQMQHELIMNELIFKFMSLYNMTT